MPGSSVRIILDSFYPLISNLKIAKFNLTFAVGCDSKSPLPNFKRIGTRYESLCYWCRQNRPT